MLPGPSSTISFRLDAALVKQLSRCASVMGISRGECAKRFVVNALADSFQESVETMLQEIRQDLRLIREEQLSATNALLQSAGRMNAEQALDFIERVMLQRETEDGDESN